MPHLVVYLMRHAALGLAAAVSFVALLVGFDIANLGTLMRSSPDGLLAVAVLTFGVSVTFCSVQMGIAVMLLDDNDDEPRGPGGGRHFVRDFSRAPQPRLRAPFRPTLRPVPVRAKTRR